jgi:sugar lactone lactonase YvrE
LLHVAGDVGTHSFSLPAARFAFTAALAVAAVTARGDVGVLSSAGPAGSEVLASGFDVLSGIAVDREGSVLVTDLRAGTLTRIAPSGARRVILDNLSNPRGVAVAADGVFVLEGGTRVLRLDPATGVVALISASLTRARAIAAGPDGRIWIAARRGPGVDDEILRLDRSGMLSRQPSGLIRIRALAVDRTGIYAVADSVAGEPIARSVLARFRWRPDGLPGQYEALLRGLDRRGNGVAIDAAGDVFVTASWPQQVFAGGGLVLKRRSSGEVGLLASGMARLGAAAFGPGRELFVVEGRLPARLLRFQPPSPPVLTVPHFTNATPFRVTGRAAAGSLVQVTTAAGVLLGFGRPDATSSFAISVPLARNAATRLAVVVTANAGNGLVGRPTAATVVHDDHLPRVEIHEPPVESHVTGPFVFRADAADDDSGMDTLRLTLDHGTELVTRVAADGEPLSASMAVDSAALLEGPHTLSAIASDRAGNWAAAARVVIVDRTPPDTFIVNSTADAAGLSAAITFGGSDGLSSAIEFSWRLDGGPWSPFTPETSVQLTGLAGGAHRFEVVARDRAGNIDPTPAVHPLVVSDLRVRILEPLPGAVITAEKVWIRGTLEGGSDAVVSVLLPETFQRQLGREELPAAHEAGTFAVELPTAAGMTALTVIAREGGRQSSETIPITVAAPLAAAPRLEVSPAAGLAPLVVRLSAAGIPPGSDYSLDLESDGRPDEEGNGLPRGQYVYTLPGVYLATLTTTAPDGRVQVARGVIQVYDRSQLEARLITAWSGFKAAMRAADPTAAASFVHRDRRAAWAEHFARLTPAQWAAADVLFTDLALVDVAPGRAECEMMRDHDGLRYSFPISFAVDAGGGWKLWQF